MCESYFYEELARGEGVLPVQAVADRVLRVQLVQDPVSVLQKGGLIVQLVLTS